MKLKLALAAASMLIAPAVMTAHAQTSNVYVSGGYTHFDGDGGAELGGVTGRVGVNFGPNFAVEGEGTFGVKDDGGTELDSELGIFAVGKLPINPSFDLFARVGADRDRRIRRRTHLLSHPYRRQVGPARGAGPEARRPHR